MQVVKFYNYAGESGGSSFLFCSGPLPGTNFLYIKYKHYVDYAENIFCPK